MKVTLTLGKDRFDIYSDGRVYRHQYIDSTGRVYKGHFLRLVNMGNSYPKLGYRKKNGTKGCASVHRLVARCYVKGYSEALEVDHIDGNRNNNDKSNLRMVSSSGNRKSFQRKTAGTSSQYRGVYFVPRVTKWAAHIRPTGQKLKYLGYFAEESDAARAYDKAALEHGFNKEALNFPEG